MNKLVLVFGVAAAAAVSGCLDPQYKARHNRPAVPGDDVDLPPPSAETRTAKPVDIDTTPGIVEEAIPEPAPVKTLDATPVAPAPVVAPVPAAPKTTEYVVQSGDTLSKISKRFNIKIAAIKAANPQIKGDVVKLGQKLSLPGDVEVPAPAPAKPAAAVKPYTGATETYKIKAGDTLGGIAYSHGTTVAQLKQMNNMKNDIVRIGRTLTVPAGKAKVRAAAPAKTEPAKTEAKKPAEAKPAAAKTDEKKTAAEPIVSETVETPAPAAAEEAPAPAAQKDPDFFLYTVKDGEDVTGIAITFDVSPSEIRQLNNLGEDAQLSAGQELKLPLPARQ